MASIRTRPRKDGTTYAVLFTVDGRQTSVPFQDQASAEKFRTVVDALGGRRALDAYEIGHRRRSDNVSVGPTVAEYLQAHIDTLTGVERKTLTEYRRYLSNDIAPALGAIPLGKLTREDVAAWVNAMHSTGAKRGTMANKHGFLAGALNVAVASGLMAGSPCDGIRIPRTEERQTVFLTRDEFQILKSGFTEHYQALVEFLVASGCRFNEAVALKASDVDRSAGTVRIARAWKQDGTRYELGAPKTKKSNRTINVPTAVLDQLDYTRPWLFTTTKGDPIRLSSWRTNVWAKSRARAQTRDEKNPDKPVLTKSPTPHDLRHTCASWLIQAGVPLPVVQAHLGHESIMTTVDRYGHLDRSSHKAAADAIAAALAS